MKIVKYQDGYLDLDSGLVYVVKVPSDLIPSVAVYSLHSGRDGGDIVLSGLDAVELDRFLMEES